jgi:hypothetical protein
MRAFQRAFHRDSAPSNFRQTDWFALFTRPCREFLFRDNY